MKTAAQLPVIGLDIAKNVFQLHIVDPETGEIERIKLKRDKVAAFFANRQPSLIALEACGGAHYWARTLEAQGHQVKLLAGPTCESFRAARQDRCTRCPGHLGGSAAAAHTASSHQK